MSESQTPDARYGQIRVPYLPMRVSAEAMFREHLADLEKRVRALEEAIRSKNARTN